MKKKPRTFENSFNFIQKILIAKYLIDNEIENVKHIFNAYKVPYSEQLAEDIKTKYAQQFTKKNNK